MTCPICKSEPVDRYRPFCSRRCADLDLGRWITGVYAIPSEEPPEVDMDIVSADGDITLRRH